MMVEEHHMMTAVLELLNDSMIIDTFLASLKLPNFMEVEELRTAPARQCRKCQHLNGHEDNGVQNVAYQGQ